MVAPTFGAANLQWAGYAPETTYGVAPALPTYFWPATAPVWGHPTDKYVDDALRGSMGAEFQQINGMRKGDTFTYTTFCYLDQVYVFLRQILGLPDVLSGASAPYLHKTSLQNGSNGQPVSASIWWYDALGKCVQLPGAQMSDLKITITTAGLVTIVPTFVCLPGVFVTPPTQTPTQSQPMPGWKSVITLAGVASTAFSEIVINIKRATESIPSLTGSQAPFAIFAGPVTVASTLKAIYAGSTDPHLLAELTNTQPSLVVALSAVGDAVNSLTMQFSRTAYDVADPTGSNKWMEIAGTTKMLTNPTDVAGGGNQSPMLVSLLSPVSTAI